MLESWMSKSPAEPARRSWSLAEAVAIRKPGELPLRMAFSPLRAASISRADNAVATGNKVLGTQLFDATDLCSNGNEAQSNMLYGNSESGVHTDSTCGGSGPGETITSVRTHSGCIRMRVLRLRDQQKGGTVSDLENF